MGISSPVHKFLGTREFEEYHVSLHLGDWSAEKHFSTARRWVDVKGIIEEFVHGYFPEIAGSRFIHDSGTKISEILVLPNGSEALLFIEGSDDEDR